MVVVFDENFTTAHNLFKTIYFGQLFHSEYLTLPNVTKLPTVLNLYSPDALIKNNLLSFILYSEEALPSVPPFILY